MRYLVFLLIFFSMSCSASKKNVVQYHQAIKENSVIKESSGYKNKESKVKGNSLRYIFRNNYGIGFYSLKTERGQIVNNLSKEIYDIEENYIIDFSYTMPTDELRYFLTLGYGFVFYGKRTLDYGQINGLSKEESDAQSVYKCFPFSSKFCYTLDSLGGSSLLIDFGYQFGSSGIALNFGYRKQNAKYDQPANSTSTSNFTTGNNSQYLIGLSLIY
mgnify:CR=1 FL=1